MMAPPAVTRFAPSPTGYLHLGHVFAASVAAQRASSGRFHLRLDDLDAIRCRPEYVPALLEDLAWLGFVAEEPGMRQSERTAAHGAALEALRAAGVLFPCFCSRKTAGREEDVVAAPHAPLPGASGTRRYSGRCRHFSTDESARRIAAGESHSLRLNVQKALALTGPLHWVDHGRGPQSVRPEALDDVILARRDLPTSYHLAVCVDDAAQGITLVTRGWDLFEATHIHRLLQCLLGLPTPGYFHHAMVQTRTGERMAKRDGGITVRGLREAGISPGEVLSRAIERATLEMPNDEPSSAAEASHPVIRQ